MTKKEVKKMNKKNNLKKQLDLLENTRKIFQIELRNYNLYGVYINTDQTKEDLENKLHALDVEIDTLKKSKKADKPFSTISTKKLTKILRNVFDDRIKQIEIWPGPEKTFIANITRPITYQIEGETINDIDHEQITLTATTLSFSNDSMCKKDIRKYQTELNKRRYFPDDLFEESEKQK